MWVLKWDVQSHSDPTRRYRVAVDERGTWACDCPRGKYHRDRGPCKHVLEVQEGAAKATTLPSQGPSRPVTTAPALSPAAAASGIRLRNVKEVYAELKSREPTPREQKAPENAAAGDLLSVLPGE